MTMVGPVMRERSTNAVNARFSFASRTALNQSVRIDSVAQIIQGVKMEKIISPFTRLVLKEVVRLLGVGRRVKNRCRPRPAACIPCSAQAGRKNDRVEFVQDILQRKREKAYPFAG